MAESKKKSRTFAEASAQIQANLQRHLKQHEHLSTLSSESEDESDCSNILENVLSKYELKSSGQTILQETICRNQNSSCIICLGSMKRTDAIYSCQNCFNSFHLQCIHRWARDSINQQQLASNETLLKKDEKFKWCCPNCRFESCESEIPSKYKCYCGSQVDPTDDPWLIPHSCGNTCNKLIKPKCGHNCLLLCHPGPCPPCPKMVSVKCYCGSAPAQSRRCHDRFWSCKKRCDRLLSCGQHRCNSICHPGDCGPCESRSFQACCCGRHKKEVNCDEPKWKCDEKCNKKLKCGHHYCQVVCHQGPCPPCPSSLPRTCPCGKSSYDLPCTEETPLCGDTCMKLLDCGIHRCSERCHRGDCGKCLQLTTKKCRCGAKQKEMPCAKPFFCETKCKKMRNCGKHPCNRKCCAGDCPPCEQICGKNLNCKNHKCVSICHQGPCYPCTATVPVCCRCKQTQILVSCGREKWTKPPKCRKFCTIPSDCHHENRENHHCHFGPCPPCRQKCLKKLKCGHTCQANCHDNVSVKISGNNARVPWEQKGPETITKTLDCPPCQQIMEVPCLGRHEIMEMPCEIAKIGSCGRKCGRKLACGNHSCQRDCHKVKLAENDFDAGSNCRQCDLPCQRKRPEGCNHPCLLPCHKEPCQPCGQMIKISCLCGLMQVYVKCEEWIVADKAKREELASCKSKCPKLLSCGHKCTKECHSGGCSDPLACRKKVKLYCACKRIKQEYACGRIAKEKITVQCDDECKLFRKQEREKTQEASEATKAELTREERMELERFERSQQGARRNNRRNRMQQDCDESQGFFTNKTTLIIVSTSFITILAAITFFLLCSQS